MSNLVELKITCNLETNQVTVNGPIDNRVLCFGILELAKVTINKYVEDKKTGKDGSRIVAPGRIDPNLLKEN